MSRLSPQISTCKCKHLFALNDFLIFTKIYLFLLACQLHIFTYIYYILLLFTNCYILWKFRPLISHNFAPITVCRCKKATSENALPRSCRHARIAVCFYKYPRFQSVNNTVSSLFLPYLPRIGRSPLKLFPNSSQVVEKSPFFIAFPIRFLPFSIFRNTKPDTVLRHSDFQTRFCLRCPPHFSRQNKKPQKNGEHHTEPCASFQREQTFNIG